MISQKKDKIIKKRTSWNKGLKGWNKGHIVSQATKTRQAESMKKWWKSLEGLLKKQRLAKIMSKRLKDKTYEQLYGNRSEKIRKKISESEKGKNVSERTKKRISKAKKGKKRKPFSAEWRKKLGNATRGKTYEDIYSDRADEIKKARSESLKGRIFSETHRKKLSESHKKGICKHKPECTCLRCKMERGELKGKNSPAWEGGISFIDYSIDWTDDLKESIRKRDNYICQICGLHQDNLKFGRVKRLDVHHIDYDKKNLNPINLITLCKKCHGKTNYNREYWTKYFIRRFEPVNGWDEKALAELKKSEKKFKKL